MQHSGGDCALLADGRTAALVDRAGEVVWLCWPRIDSDPVLLSILDEQRGGTFRVAPRGDDVELLSRQAVDDGLVTRTTWRSGAGRLVVDDALVTEGRAGLVRLLRAEGRPVLVEVRFRPAFAWGAAEPRITESGRRAVAAGDRLLLAVDAPAPWRIDAGVAVCIFRVVPGYPAAVALGDAAGGTGLGDVPERLAATLRHWRATLDACTLELPSDALSVRAVGAATSERLLRRSAAVITGLRQRGGGLVAAPTSSLPQYPGTSRCWDYRYAWVRDTVIGARALLRLGLVDEAHGLGAFIGDVCSAGDPPPLCRVDEEPAPPEREIAWLAGHGGARPVRHGNGAALQGQGDLQGDALVLAGALARARALPESLRRAVPLLAATAAARAGEEDHGIWEIRGPARWYTHSRIAAWAGLREAAALARAGVVRGDAEAWESAARRLRGAVLDRCVDGAGALTLHAGGGGPDAACLTAVTSGFLRADDPRATATLDAVEARLLSGGLVERHLAAEDSSDEPCLPFLFPTFWLAQARELIGRDGSAVFATAAACRGPLDLMGEVADPATSTPHGNVPQVQSHAALVLASWTRGRAG